MPSSILPAVALALLVAQPGLCLSLPQFSSRQQVSKRALGASTDTAGGSNFGIPLSDGTRSSPWGVTNDAFGQALDRPDAMASFSFIGQDTAIPYPGNGLTGGWSLSINVSSNVPLTSSSDTTTQDGVSVRDKVTSGSRIRIRVPDKLIKNGAVSTDPTWNFCVFLFTSGGLQLQQRLRGDNGSCAVAMGEQCSRDVVTAVQTNAGGTGKGAGGLNICNCPDISTVPSCQQAGVFNGGVQCSTFSFNASYMGNVNKWKNGEFELLEYGGPVHTQAAGASTFSESVRGLVWPIVTQWAPVIGVGNSTAALTCVTANTTQTQVKLSFGTTTQASSWMFGLAAASAAVLAFW